MDIKKLRSDLQLTQVALARKVGVSPQTIRLWEWRVMNPSPENMEKLKRIENGCEELSCDNNLGGQCNKENVDCKYSGRDIK